MGSSSTSWASEANTHAGSSKVFSSSTWDAIVTTDSLKINAASGQAAKFELHADAGEDGVDQWLLNIADGGTMTWANNSTTRLTLTAAGALSSIGSLSMVDSAKINVGTGSDLTIFHDGSDSHITNALGALNIATATSGITVNIGHTTSSTVAIGDNLTVADDLTVSGGTLSVTGEIKSTLGATLGGTFSRTATAGDGGYGNADVIIVGTDDIVALGLYNTTQKWDIISITSGTGDTNDYFGIRDVTNSTTPFRIEETAPAHSLAVDATGFVGIGISTATENLHVYNSGEVEVKIASTDNNAVLTLSSETGEGADSKILFASAATDRGSIVYDHNTTAASQKMNFIVGDNAVPALSILGSGEINVGVDDTGYDVKFFGATASSYFLWDESRDRVLIYSDQTGFSPLYINTAYDFAIQIHSTNGGGGIRFTDSASTADQEHTIMCEGDELALKINDVKILTVDSTGFMNRASIEDVTATNVITAGESGRTFFLNSGTEFVSTLPAPAVGLNYTFIVKAAPVGADYTVTTNAGADIIIGLLTCATADDAGAFDANGDTVHFEHTHCKVGDWIRVISDGTSWYLSGASQLAEGITISTT